MKTRKLTGFILNIKSYGEYDRMLFIFSRQLGLLRVLAKGIRKLGSRRSFHIDLINASRMEIEESNSVSYLREIMTVNSYTVMKKQPEHFCVACIIASFLLSSLPESMPHEKLFDMTKKIFEALNVRGMGMREAHGTMVKDLLLVYLLKATKELGYMPNSLPKHKLRKTLNQVLCDLNPQFTLQARRTLGIFSNFESTRSS